LGLIYWVLGYILTVKLDKAFLNMMTTPPSDPKAPASEPTAPYAYDAWLAVAQQALNVSVTSAQVALFQQYYQLLQGLNAQVNLVRIPNEATYVTRHLLDALTAWPLLAALPPGTPVLDVGSGGGIPLLPLAIVLPHLQWHSMEATTKKVKCLQTMASALGLTVQFHTNRMEACHKLPQHAGRYAVITARAVAPLERLVPWVAPLLQSKGRLLAFKGQKATLELTEANGVMQRHRLRLQQTLTWPQVPDLVQATLLELVKA
jgi:16S rRNA (guanine527-N7)-methyltransferase